jgi:hypothetical protein
MGINLQIVLLVLLSLTISIQLLAQDAIVSIGVDG